jgi:hypothetical protein
VQLAIADAQVDHREGLKADTSIVRRHPQLMTRRLRRAMVNPAIPSHASGVA